MKEVKAFRCECGRKYFTKRSAVEHEKICTCWTNEKYRTCKTCKHEKYSIDSNGMDSEPQFLETWRYLDCQNPRFEYDKHFRPAHKNAENLCINCPVWEPKNSVR